ncbi:hypothetical protein [Levilactobacillus suantsaiihabitans]|uniref:Uncharacterized protein n=1 Tax=Levilactobacillus suantsaiihabitans TaxID=2487722 RepID=A0A4Z0J572_9LACO|nr:hypothetical protein [Levilactobacillus suantsaiihabitans]TGD17550.1 hypothetical protein EGT51_11830 [Levilactobacillus suantsaiihabitans]
MIDKEMWRDWIRLKMVSTSQRSIPFNVASEAYLLGRDELDENLLPGELEREELPRQVVVYMYGTCDNEVLGYIIASEELDVMYVAGVLVDGKLSWAELGGEIE